MKLMDDGLLRHNEWHPTLVDSNIVIGCLRRRRRAAADNKFLFFRNLHFFRLTSFTTLYLFVTFIWSDVHFENDQRCWRRRRVCVNLPNLKVPLKLVLAESAVVWRWCSAAALEVCHRSRSLLRESGVAGFF
jgi:hypothetical protein